MYTVRRYQGRVNDTDATLPALGRLKSQGRSWRGPRVDLLVVYIPSELEQRLLSSQSDSELSTQLSKAADRRRPCWIGTLTGRGCRARSGSGSGSCSAAVRGFSLSLLLHCRKGTRALSLTGSQVARPHPAAVTAAFRHDACSACDACNACGPGRASRPYGPPDPPRASPAPPFMPPRALLFFQWMDRCVTPAGFARSISPCMRCCLLLFRRRACA